MEIVIALIGVLAVLVSLAMEARKPSKYGKQNLINNIFIQAEYGDDERWHHKF